MNLADVDRRKLGVLLDELAGSVEELLLSGLTTASAATRRVLEVSFQEASRLRLLRLGATLRTANEELGKFVQQKEGFSRKRLCFFLTRAWLLCKGLAEALQKSDDKEFDRLLRTPTGEAVERVEVVTLGVVRKIVPGSFCAFDFRLRGVADGRSYVWSCVFPLTQGQDVPAEGFLHLTQKQGFKPLAFLDGKVITLHQVTVSTDEACGRITLGAGSKAEVGAAFTDWKRFLDWDATAALERVRNHQPGPLDLDVELQEEVVLREWELGKPEEEDEGVQAYPITQGETTFHALVSASEESKPLREALAARKKKGQPPLFGLMHYERCRLVVQPLAVVGSKGPEFLTLSNEKVNLAALLKTIKF